MLKIIAVAFAGLAVVLTAAAVLWRHPAPAPGAAAEPPSLSANDIFVNVDAESFSGVEFDDGSLAFPRASDASKTNAPAQRQEASK